MVLKASTQKRLGSSPAGKTPEEVWGWGQRGLGWACGAEGGRVSGLEDAEVLRVMSLGENWRVRGSRD